MGIRHGFSCLILFFVVALVLCEIRGLACSVWRFYCLGVSVHYFWVKIVSGGCWVGLCACFDFGLIVAGKFLWVLVFLGLYFCWLSVFNF